MRLQDALAIAALALMPASAWGQTCPSQGRERARVATVEGRLELRLADGRLLRLAGVEPAAATPADPDLGETTRRTLANDVVGKEITLSLFAMRPDRWGRLPAFVALEDSTAPGGLAAQAIGAGLGRVVPERATAPCRDAFRAAETKAREGKLGLWADPYYGVLAVDDQAAFAERSGTIVVAEGRLVAVEPGLFRTMLRFAPPRPHDRHVLAAVILPRVKKTFEARGVMVQSLIGQTVRLRGLLDLRFGPRLELTDPDDVEIVATQGR